MFPEFTNGSCCLTVEPTLADRCIFCKNKVSVCLYIYTYIIKPNIKKVGGQERQTVLEIQFVNTQTSKSFGIRSLAFPALALRKILLITVPGPGLSTSTSTLARNSSAGPKESRNNFMSSKSKSVNSKGHSYGCMPHISYSSILPYLWGDNNSSPITPATFFFPLLNKVSQDLI